LCGGFEQRTDGGQQALSCHPQEEECRHTGFSGQWDRLQSVKASNARPWRLVDYQPLRLQLIEDVAGRHLFQQYIQRYHPLGYRVSSGRAHFALKLALRQTAHPSHQPSALSQSNQLASTRSCGLSSSGALTASCGSAG
jgi:hypothetical protein